MLYPSSKAQKTTIVLDKLPFTDYVVFGICENSVGCFSWSKNDSNYLDVKYIVFKRDEKSLSSYLM